MARRLHCSFLRFPEMKRQPLQNATLTRYVTTYQKKENKMKKTEQKQDGAWAKTEKLDGVVVNIHNVWNKNTSEYHSFQVSKNTWKNVHTLDIEKIRIALARVGNTINKLYIDGVKAGLNRNECTSLCDEHFAGMSKGYRSNIRKFADNNYDIIALCEVLESKSICPTRMVKFYNENLNKVKDLRASIALKILAKYHESEAYQESDEVAMTEGKLIEQNQDVAENQDLKKGFKVNSKTTPSDMVKICLQVLENITELTANNELSFDELGDIFDKTESLQRVILNATDVKAVSN